MLMISPPMLANLPLEELARILHSHVTPTEALQPQAHRVQDAQVHVIADALKEPGRTIFIYGDAGVGKTPLATEIATHQVSDQDALAVESNAPSTFSVLIHVGSDDRGNPSLNSQPESQGTRTEEPAAIGGDASLALLLKAGEEREEDTFIVIDEFDRITSDTERVRFANFVKQIGDLRLAIRFIFCGVSDSLKALLESHESRYIENSEASTPSGASFQIINRSRESLNRIPHYVHLLSEELFWEMFNDPTFAISLR